ncbi:MAG: hypothetical protein LH491_09650 [Pseudoxanthomonas sp.]|nr:hypothetical protein [Pseudoxanthomonas sp.]
MKTKTLLPLTAAALFAACAGAMFISGQSITANAASMSAPASTHIVDLPTVTVRPAAKDLAYFQANRIVDLATVTVHPQADDLAIFVASHAVRVVDLPTLTVRASADDVQGIAFGVAAMAQQIASR